MLRPVAIDQDAFLSAFGRDVDFHDNFPQHTYLDLDKGHIEWVYDEDEDAETEGIPDNAGTRAKVLAAPSRYLEVPGFSHGECHEILRQFLEAHEDEDGMGDYSG